MVNEQNPLKPGQMVPDFTLPSSRGRPLRISDFRNRSNLLIVFTGDGVDQANDWLRRLGEHVSDLNAAETQAIIVTPISIDELDRHPGLTELPFPILADRSSQVLDSIQGLSGNPLVIVTDRFGEIYSIDQELLDPDELLATLNFIELQCPE